MAGLVQSKRISNRDKGQPRLLYSLVGNHSFLITSSTDFVEKKFLRLSDYNKIILKIWFLEDAELHYFLEKAFWFLEERLGSIEAILFDRKSSGSDSLQLLIVSDDSSNRRDLKKLQVKSPGGQSKSVVFSVKTKAELARSGPAGATSLYQIYDPLGLINQEKKFENGV